MQTEIEVKFLFQVIDEVRDRLREAGAHCLVPMRLMRRAIMDYPDMRLQNGAVNGYIRVRDEGDRVTCTYKQFNSLSVMGAEEIEVTIDSFDSAIELLSVLGLQVTSMQESKRETWILNDCRIEVDEWPWLNPYIEIEGSSEDAVRRTADMLGYDWKDAAFGDVMVAYRAKYPHLSERDTIGTLSEIRFRDELPSLLQEPVST